jgi:hypothetical protein
MTVLELCSLVRNPKHQEVILHVSESADNEIVFKDSAYYAMLSDFANCEVFDFGLVYYGQEVAIDIHIIKESL